MTVPTESAPRSIPADRHDLGVGGQRGVARRSFGSCSSRRSSWGSRCRRSHRGHGGTFGASDTAFVTGTGDRRSVSAQGEAVFGVDLLVGSVMEGFGTRV